jgi:hypothetical protein
MKPAAITLALLALAVMLSASSEARLTYDPTIPACRCWFVPCPEDAPGIDV